MRQKLHTACSMYEFRRNLFEFRGVPRVLRDDFHLHELASWPFAHSLNDLLILSRGELSNISGLCAVRQHHVNSSRMCGHC